MHHRLAPATLLAALTLIACPAEEPASRVGTPLFLGGLDSGAGLDVPGQDANALPDRGPLGRDAGGGDGAVDDDAAAPDVARPDTTGVDTVTADRGAADTAPREDAALPEDAGEDECDDHGDCDDLNICNGREECDALTNRCVNGTAIVCEPVDDCHTALCDPTEGCLQSLIDGDEDGFASEELGDCGTDCNDAVFEINPDAVELCDAADHDCDGDPEPASPPTWYRDCDEDGFAVVGADSFDSCEMPPVFDCGWTLQAPIVGVAGFVDCDDTNDDMYPGQTAFFTEEHSAGSTDDERYGNYNCNGIADHEHTLDTGISGRSACTLSVVRGDPYESVCLGVEGWTGAVPPPCGRGGEYSACAEPERCTAAPATCERDGFQLVCIGPSEGLDDPCYCPRLPCTPSCTPGERECPWSYLRCSRESESLFMGCQ